MTKRILERRGKFIIQVYYEVQPTSFIGLLAYLYRQIRKIEQPKEWRRAYYGIEDFKTLEAAKAYIELMDKPDVIHDL